MPIPTPNKLETESSFMSRCVSFVMGEGTPQEQAVAICSSQYRQEKVKTLTWKTIDRKRASYLPYAKTQFKRALKAQANEYLDKVKANGISEDYEISSAPIEQAMRNVYKRVMVQFGRDTYNDLIRQANKTERNWADWVDTWFDDNVIELPDLMTNTTSRSIRKIAKQSIIEGWTLREFQNNLMSDYAVSERRAELIGRTEIIRASNAGSLAGAQETNIPMRKFWLSTRDNRTRGANPKDIYDHFSVDENKGYPLDEAFRISGELLMHPGDRSNGAMPGNTINCRCTLTYQVIEEEEGEVYIEESVEPTDFASKEDFEKRWHEEYPWDNDQEMKRVAIDTKPLKYLHNKVSDGAHYFNEGIDMSTDKLGVLKSKRVFHHEFGHAIDFQFSNIINQAFSSPSVIKNKIEEAGLIGSFARFRFAFSNLAIDDAVKDYVNTFDAKKKYLKLRKGKDGIASNTYTGYIDKADELFENGNLISHLEESFDNGIISFEELLNLNGTNPEDFGVIVNKLYQQDKERFIAFTKDWLRNIERTNDGFSTRYVAGMDGYNFLAKWRNTKSTIVRSPDGRVDFINYGLLELAEDLGEEKIRLIRYYTNNDNANVNDFFGSLTANKHIIEGHTNSYYRERKGSFFRTTKNRLIINQSHVYEAFANHVALRASDLGPLHLKVMNHFQPNVQNKFIHIIKSLDEANLTNLIKLYDEERFEEFADGFIALIKKIQEVGANAYVDNNYITRFMARRPIFFNKYKKSLSKDVIDYADEQEFLDKFAEVLLYSPESYWVVEGFKSVITIEQYRRLVKYIDGLLASQAIPERDIVNSIINEYPDPERAY